MAAGLSVTPTLGSSFSTPNWTITFYYAAILIFSFVLMKAVNAALSDKPILEKLTYLLFSPLLSIRTWEQRIPIDGPEFLRLVLRACIAIPALAVVYWKFPSFVEDHQLPWGIGSYLAIIPFVVLLEAIGVATQLASIPMCGALPPLLDKPYLSRTLAEFWGKRWNPWLGGWFWEVLFRRFRRHPAWATLVAFGASGLWHELLVSIPLWLVFRENLFGLMLAYFLIQAAGLLAERRLPRRRFAWIRTCWTWIFVLTPVPLVLNRGTLLIFHLSPP